MSTGARGIAAALVLSCIAVGCGGKRGGGAGGGATATGSTGGPTSTGGLAAAITAPARNATVSNSVTFAASVAGGAGGVRVDFLADGAPLGSDSAAPYQLPWDTRNAHANPLPAPNHPMDFGYYFVDGRYGDFRAEVNGYTNLYYALVDGYPTNLPWGPLFSQSIANAVADGRQIHLNLSDPAKYGEALNRARPGWQNVRRIELADEPGWTRAETEQVIRDLRALLAAKGLARRPIGAVYTERQVLNGNGIFANGLEWVGIEAYVSAPGDANSQVNVDALKRYVNQAKARVPAAKDLVLVLMAYDRNGNWRNLATLVDLQRAGYELAFDDPRVQAITMFSYARPGGSRDHPELRVPHMQMAEKILGRRIGALSNGRHTLTVRATDRAGAVATDTISVNVAN